MHKLSSIAISASLILLACDINSGNTAEKSGDLVFLDQFEYIVNRDDRNADKIFQSKGGWGWAKTNQANQPGAKGYLYTTNHIPGYTGDFPGNDSKRVLAMEALPYTLRTGNDWSEKQTDFYLEYGDENDSRGTIPGNVWFQFWIYLNDYDDPKNKHDQISGFARRMKFLYPCNSFYPCTKQNWLFMLGGTSNLPYFKELGTPTQDDPSKGLYMQLHNSRDIYLKGAPEGDINAYKLGHTDALNYIHSNQWTLVKIHIDTSTTSGRWEAWIKPRGNKWKKVVEWIDGEHGLTWKVSDPGGHRVLRMPTTVGDYDSWIYMDDFVIAKSEDALPKYK